MKRRDFIKAGSLALAGVAVGTGHADARGTLGRIRITNDNLADAGIRRGDLVLVNLNLDLDLDHQREGDLCAVFVGEGRGKLLVRYCETDAGGDTRTTRGPGSVVKVYADGCAMIFGPVVRVERDGRPVAARLNLRDFTGEGGR